MSETRYHLSVLGKPIITGPSGTPVDLPIGKPLALLSFLSLEIKPASRDELCQIFWPESTRRRAQGSLRQAIWLLRRILGQDVLEGEGEFLGPAGDHISNDIEQVEALLSANKTLEAADLWRGDPFADLSLPDAPEWSRWTDEIRSRYEWRLEESLWVEGESLRTAGNPKEALRRFRRGTVIRPYSPRCHASLLECQLQLGLLAEAEDALGRARGIFEDELDEGLEECEARILAARRKKLEQTTGPDPAAEQLRFVGRAAEMSALSALWASAKRENPATTLVCGEPGVGKTRLLREFLDFVTADEGEVVRWRAAKVEESLEWGVAAEFVKQLQKMPGAAGITDASTQALGFLNPSSAQSGWSVPGPILMAGFADAIDDLISAVSFEAPLLVLLDDFQWVDQPTRAILAKVVRVKSRRSVMFLFAQEPDPGSPDPSRLVRDLGIEPGEVTILNLGPLKEEEYREAMAGKLESGYTLDTITSRLFQETSGNPLALEEALFSLRQSGTLVAYADGKLKLSRTQASQDLPTEEKDGTPFTERLRPLSIGAKTLVGSLANFGIPASVPELAQETGFGLEEVEEVVQELLSAGLLGWESDDRLDLVHGTFREEAIDLLQVGPPKKPQHRTRPQVRRATTGIGGILLLAGIVSLLLGSSSLSSLDHFGGGALVFSTVDSVFILRGLGPDGEKEGRRNVGTGPTGAVGIGQFVLPGDTGHSLFFLEEQESGSSTLVRLHPDGSRSELHKMEGSARILEASPDGSVLLLETFSQTQTDPGRFQIVGVDLAGEHSTDLYETSAPVRSLDWSRDRWMIAALVDHTGGSNTQGDYSRETLVLLTPDGRPVDSISLGQAREAVWCGPGQSEILISREERGRPPSLWRFPVTGSPPGVTFGVPEELDLRFPMATNAVACSPSGEGIIYVGVDGSVRQIVVEEYLGRRWQTVPWDPSDGRGEILNLDWRPLPGF